MLLTYKDFKISDFTWEKTFDRKWWWWWGRQGPLSPPLSLSLRPWYSKKMHLPINRTAEASALS